MVVFLLLLSLLVVPASAVDVYDISSDADAPVSVADALLDVGIMPLADVSWSTTDSLHLSQIADRLISGGSSVASLLSTISAKIGNNPNTIFYYLNTMDNRLSNLHNAIVGTGYVGGVSMGEGIFGHLRNMTQNYLSPISSNAGGIYTQVKAIADKMDSSGQSFRDLLLSNPNDYYLLSTGSVVGGIDSASLASINQSGFAGLASVLRSLFLSDPNDYYLTSLGSFIGGVNSASLAHINQSGFGGLAQRLSAFDGSTAFSFLQEDIFATPQQVQADNLLDALGVMGTQLQNPLQKLAYVFANPQDLEIRQDVSDNLDQAQEDFFKPDGAGAVSPGDIKDAAGFTSGAGDLLNTGASAGDVFTFVNQNYDFWSEATAQDLDDTGAVEAYSDDYVPFYENWELDEDGFFVLYNPDFVDDYLKKGG